MTLHQLISLHESHDFKQSLVSRLLRTTMLQLLGLLECQPCAHSTAISMSPSQVIRELFREAVQGVSYIFASSFCSV
jgi:hypothetical protein